MPAPTYPIRPEHLTTTLHNPWTTPWPARGTALRTMDCDIDVQWQRIAKQLGLLDWADMDRLEAECRRRGIVLVDCIYGTPSFYSTSRENDAYGFKGGRGKPREIDRLYDFVRARVSRFNDPRKGKRLITMIEAWNEPRGYYEPVTPSPMDPEPPGFTPDWAAVADLEQVVTRAAHDADHGIIATTPSMLGHRLADLVAYIAAGGCRHADALAIHRYGASPSDLDAMLVEAKAIMRKTLGRELPIALTECGHQPRYSTRFKAMPLSKQALEWANCILLAASHGCLSYVTYSQDPGQHAVDAGEVFPIGKVYTAAARILAPYMGKRVRKAAAWTAAKPVWVIGNRKVVL